MSSTNQCREIGSHRLYRYHCRHVHIMADGTRECCRCLAPLPLDYMARQTVTRSILLPAVYDRLASETKGGTAG